MTFNMTIFFILTLQEVGDFILSSFMFVGGDGMMINDDLKKKRRREHETQSRK